MLAARGSRADAPQKCLELLRSDFRTERVAVLTDAPDLTEEQGAAFWPIHRDHDRELNAPGDRRTALTRELVNSDGSLSDEMASGSARDWLSIETDRARIRKEQFDTVARAVSALVAARFIPVENILSMLADLQVAAELPLLE